MKIIQYTLFESRDERRLIIAPTNSDYRFTCLPRGGTYAESWLDAKKRLGFELSLAQQWLLDRQLATAA